MTTLNEHGRRITTLEGRVREIETSLGETSYRLRRDTVANRLGIERILDHLELSRITGSQVDEVLDAG